MIRLDFKANLEKGIFRIRQRFVISTYFHFKDGRRPEVMKSLWVRVYLLDIPLILMPSEKVGKILEELANLSPEESRELADQMRRSENRNVRSLRTLICNPWMVNRVTFLLLQLAWVVVAAMSLIAGIYLLTPAYAISSNTTELMKSFLEAVAQNPDLLGVADPVMKLLGFAMLVVAVVAFYQAHMLRQAYEEHWGG